MKKYGTSITSFILPVIFLGTGIFGFIGITRAVTIDTILSIEVCGDGISGGAEPCDNPSDPGTYSTSIAGRNCMPTCVWAPYCGDAIVQTIYSEQCDDGNNASSDFCSSDCRAESVPPGSGTGGSTTPPGGGGSGSNNPGTNTPVPDTHVSVTGRAYPHSDVNILQDGKIVGIVKANAKADFLFTMSGITPGTSTFGFWAQDDKGLKSIAFNTTLQIIQGAVTTVSGVFIPPTIEIDKKVLGRGDVLKISGSSVPDSKVTSIVNSSNEIKSIISADDKGKWKLDLDTAPLENGVHTTKAFFNTQLYDYVAKSDFSQTLTFFVGVEPTGDIGSSDINGDGKVNLVDFSIMLFNWGNAGKGTASDINGDNTVNLTDFSILLFNWTG